MSRAALAIAAFSAALSAFAALSLAMERHFQDSFGRGHAPGRWLPWLRGSGACALVVSLLACLTLQGSTQGWVLWLGMLTVSSFVVVGVLSYIPRWSLYISLLSNVVCVLALFKHLLQK